MTGFLICLALTVVCCALIRPLSRIQRDNYELIPMLLAAMSFTGCIGFLGVWVCGHLAPQLSPYLAFARGAALPEILYVLTAVSDIRDKSRSFHGLFGALILIYAMPCCLLLQLIDLIVWLVRR